MNLWTLLDPQTEIAVNFLNILCGLVLYAMYLLQRVGADMRRCATLAEAGVLDPELERFADERVYISSLKSVWERRVEALPGVMLVIGLMGTFFGLAFAIRQAADSLHSVANASEISAQIAQLSEALKTMGMKFQTSIYGIACSLVTRAASSLWVERERERFATTLRPRFAMLRAEAAERRRVQQAWISDKLAVVASHTEQLPKLDELAGVIRALQGNVAMLTDAVGLLRGALTSFDTVARSADRFSAATNAVTAATSKLEATTAKSFEAFSGAVTGSVNVSRALAVGVERLDKLGTEAADRSKKSTEAVTLAAQTLASKTTALEGALGRSLERVAAGVEQSTPALRSLLAATTRLEGAATVLHSELNERARVEAERKAAAAQRAAAKKARDGSRR